MFDSEPVPFFQSPGQVNPRDDKYVVRKERNFTIENPLHKYLLYFGALFYFSYFVSHVYMYKRSGLTPDPIRGLKESITRISPGSSFGFFIAHWMQPYRSSPIFIEHRYALLSNRKRQQTPIDATTKNGAQRID